MEFFFIGLVLGTIVFLIVKAIQNSGGKEPTEFAYSYAKSTVVKALEAAATKCKLKIKHSDPVSGSFRFGVGVSAFSNGEWIDVQVIQHSDSKTTVKIKSSPKFGFNNSSRNRKNIERLSSTISSELSKYQPAKETSKVQSVADEISKLKSLLDSGVLTQKEYEEQKARLLK